MPLYRPTPTTCSALLQTEGLISLRCKVNLAKNLIFVVLELTVHALPSGSAGEAAFMTGLERNSDIVFAASYAPTLQVCLKSRLMIIS